MIVNGSLTVRNNYIELCFLMTSYVNLNAILTQTAGFNDVIEVASS